MAEDDTLGGEEDLAVGTKDWADVILAMRQSAVDRFNSRRNLEWKLSFTLWGAVALSANVLRFVEVDGSLRALLLVGGTAIIGMHAWLAHAFYTGGRRDRDDGIALDHLLRAHVPGPVWPVAKRPYKPVVAHFILVAITFLLVLFAVFVAPGASAS